MSDERKEGFDWLRASATVLALAMAAHHLLFAKMAFLPLDQHKVIHVGFALALSLLGLYSTQKSLLSRAFLVASIGVAAGLTFYFVAYYYDIVMRIGYPRPLETTLGILIVGIVLETTRRNWGNTIPAVAILGMLYGYFGYYLPGIFFHGGIPIPRLFAYASTYYRGIYGSLTGVSSVEVFLFITYGCLLKAAGGLDLFMKVGQVAGSRLRSGPAQAAVVTSGLMGTISGTIAANVATTGAFTIPTMIKRGYSKEYAGAIEAVASTGGQLVPPVMGIAAFLIAGLTGISYLVVCQAALLPALAYYLYLAVTVQIRAVKMNLPMTVESTEGLWGAVKEHGYLVLSLAVMVYSLALRNPPGLAAFHGITTLCLTFCLAQFFRRGFGQRTLRRILEFLKTGFEEGAVSGAKIAIVIATLGIIVELFIVTGFAQKLSHGMLEISGGNLLLLAVLAGVTCIFFGMGMPTTGAYLLVALLGAPAMVDLGIPMLAAHFFVFYFGLMSSVTPPVAVGALVASGISGGNYLKTAITSARLALPGFLMPFFFLYRPQILWAGYPLGQVFLVFISVLLGLVSMTFIFENFTFRRLRLYERGLLLVTAVLLLEPEVLTSVLGMALFAVVLLLQRRGMAGAARTSQ